MAFELMSPCSRASISLLKLSCVAKMLISVKSKHGCWAGKKSKTASAAGAGLSACGPCLRSFKLICVFERRWRGPLGARAKASRASFGAGLRGLHASPRLGRCARCARVASALSFFRLLLQEMSSGHWGLDLTEDLFFLAPLARGGFASILVKPAHPAFASSAAGSWLGFLASWQNSFSLGLLLLKAKMLAFLGAFTQSAAPAQCLLPASCIAAINFIAAACRPPFQGARAKGSISKLNLARSTGWASR
jgi:hypothetical protein